MKYVKGFMMAWGNFAAIPCPSNKWHEECRGAMLNMLPLIGTLLGVICMAVWSVLDLFQLNSVFVGVVITALYFWICGFIHLDGFMDCSDAILSRRPELEDRQRILKDSHVGAFAVIAIAFMLMLFGGSLAALSASYSLKVGGLFIIVLTWSRTFAVCDVINKKPMQTSQYNGNVYEDMKEKGRPAIIAAAAVTVIVYMTLIFDWSVVSGMINVFTFFYTIVLIALIKVVTAKVGNSARNQLGGMNGDISGCMIVLGEMSGVMGMVLVMNFMG